MKGGTLVFLAEHLNITPFDRTLFVLLRLPLVVE